MSSSKKHVLLRYLSFARPYRWWLLIVILAGIAKFTLPLLIPYFTGRLVDRVILNTGRLDQAGQLSLLWQYAALLAGVIVLTGIAIFIRGFFTVRLTSSIAFDIRQSLWKHLQRLDLGFHQSRPTGSILSRLMSDIGVSQQMMNAGIVNVSIDAISGAAALVVLFSISTTLTLIVLAVLPFYGILYRKINPRIRQASRDVQEQTSVMSGSVVERLAGIAVVQSFAQEKWESQEFAVKADELRGRTIRRGILSQTLSASSEFLVSLATLAVWIVGGYLAVAGGGITVGQLLQFTGSAAMLYLPIRRFSQINITYQTSMAAIERIFAVFDVVPEVRNRPGATDRVIGMGGLDFDDVTFAYPSGPDILRNVSFTVPPGQHVAIVGESGAGKSTLVTLIPRLYDVTGGAIRIDGVDIRDYKVRTLRRGIGIVLQESILFSGTIHENLRYGRKNASFHEIVEAARTANVHDFILSLPEKYDTVIGERGMNLSGGQRQRISLARTLLQNPRILILDEATSSLDSESENLITEALDRVMDDRTSLIIAHRLSTIMGAEKILVFHEGRLVEQGKHEDLLNAGGYYRHLFEQQFGPLQELVARSGLMNDFNRANAT